MSDSGGTGTGRGLAFITAAKLYFIATGFFVQLGLPRLLGSPEAFGEYSLAMSIVSVINNVLIAATVQSVSKRVSEGEAMAAARLRQGLKLQLCIGVVLAGGLFSGAPLLARFAYDEKLERLVQIAAAVPLCYAIYAALVGSLNGRRLFQRQAALDATFSTVRSVGILGAAALGFGSIGAVTGFAMAAFVILTIALVVVGIGSKGETLPLKTWFAFLVPIVAFQATLNSTMLLDVWVLKNTVAELGLAATMTMAAASEQASRYVGFYRAGQTFALVPYQVILSVTFVVFPLVSRATAEGDHDTARQHILHALRFSLLVLFGLAAPIGGSAEALIRLAYGPKFLQGQETLSVLVFGQMCLAMFVIVATILSGAGRPGTPAWISLLALVIVLAANRMLVTWVGIGPHTLRAAAFATSLGPFVALLMSSFSLRAAFGISLPWPSVLRGAFAAVCAFWVARVVPQHSPLLAPIAMSAGALGYLAALFATREIKLAEVRSVVDAVRNRRARGAVAPPSA
jgi:stage V sporulation protein B